MHRRVRIAGYAALFGFLGCTLSITCLMATICPMKSCDDCPVVFCQSTPAKAPETIDAHRALLPSSLDQFRLASAPVRVPPAAQVSTFLPHEFRRPMRN